MGRHLAGDDAEAFLDALIGSSDELLMANLFRAWNEKDITEDEIYFIAKIMRLRCTKIATKHEGVVDIVGTGGSRSKTFNVSTAASFVVAGAGMPVAKHGNRAATSNSGSADVLTELDVEPAVDPATAERCLNDIGICFMFAPNFHRLSPTLGKVRRSLGFPTVFNCVGPLCNPAGAPHQLIGVWKHGLLQKMAAALARLGTGRSWVVHGHDGSDEITLDGTTFVAAIIDGQVHEFEVTPESFGINAAKTAELKVSTPGHSAELIRKALAGDARDSAAERLILVNAAATIHLAGGSETLPDGFDIARESIRSGRAFEKLRELAAYTRS